MACELLLISLSVCVGGWVSVYPIHEAKVVGTCFPTGGHGQYGEGAGDMERGEPKTLRSTQEGREVDIWDTTHINRGGPGGRTIHPCLHVLTPRLHSFVWDGRLHVTCGTVFLHVVCYKLPFNPAPSITEQELSPLRSQLEELDTRIMEQVSTTPLLN